MYHFNRKRRVSKFRAVAEKTKSKKYYQVLWKSILFVESVGYILQIKRKINRQGLYLLNYTVSKLMDRVLVKKIRIYCRDKIFSLLTPCNRQILLLFSFVIWNLRKKCIIANENHLSTVLMVKFRRFCVRVSNFVVLRCPLSWRACFFFFHRNVLEKFETTTIQFGKFSWW